MIFETVQLNSKLVHVVHRKKKWGVGIHNVSVECQPKTSHRERNWRHAMQSCRNNSKVTSCSLRIVDAWRISYKCAVCLILSDSCNAFFRCNSVYNKTSIKTCSKSKIGNGCLCCVGERGILNPGYKN